MSCSDNKTAAIANFSSPSNPFAPGVSPIEVFEETVSTDNECTCGVTKGTLNATLTFAGGIFPTIVNGSGKIYLKVSKQAGGFSVGVNTPPVDVEDPATYDEDDLQTVTLNTSFVSTTYADVTPAFSATNLCGTDTVLGWQMTDAQVVMTRTIIKVAEPRFS